MDKQLKQIIEQLSANALHISSAKCANLQNIYRKCDAKLFFDNVQVNVNLNTDYRATQFSVTVLDNKKMACFIQHMFCDDNDGAINFENLVACLRVLTARNNVRAQVTVLKQWNDSYCAQHKIGEYATK